MFRCMRSDTGMSDSSRGQHVVSPHLASCNSWSLVFCSYKELDWSAEEFSAGCYVGVMPPQFITNYFKIMREPMGAIHFGGTETAFE